MQLRTAGAAIEKDERIGLMRRRGSMMSPCGQGAQLSFRTIGEVTGEISAASPPAAKAPSLPQCAQADATLAPACQPDWAQGFRACYPGQGRAVLI